MNKRKICVITGSRAEYGLLYWLIKGIDLDQDLDLQLIVTGMHLCDDFGLTFKEIERDFKIDRKIDMNLSSDTSLGISKSMSLAQSSFSEAYNDLNPDIVLVLGDRYEIFSAVTAAMISKLPIAHIHGGESTEGSIDEAIRHSITKMSHIHFTAADEYSKRIIQLGEDPVRVFNVGGMGIENIKRHKFLSKEEFENSINFKLNLKNILVTFHPVTLENRTSEKQFRELINSISELKNTHIIFTKTNSDLGGKIINEIIDEFSIQNKEKTIAITSMGQLKYLSAMMHVDLIIGNSSSGLLEAPSFNIGTINIGDRQKGRIKADSVIDCSPNKKDIDQSLKKIYSSDFQKKLKYVKNPYDNGFGSSKIIKVLKTISLKNMLKKSFYDINFSL